MLLFVYGLGGDHIGKALLGENYDRSQTHEYLKELLTADLNQPLTQMKLWVTTTPQFDRASAVLETLLKRTLVVRIYVRTRINELWDYKWIVKHDWDLFEKLMTSYEIIEDWNQRYPPHKTYSSTMDFIDAYRRSNKSPVSSLLSEMLSLIRPSWREYFMQLAYFVARRSNCKKRRVGAVIVRNKRIIATGYNGTPSNSMNCLDGGCKRCSSPRFTQAVDLDGCVCIHAEVNALLESTRGPDTEMYVTVLPCMGCAKLIIQAGITKVFYDQAYDNAKSIEVFKGFNVSTGNVKLPIEKVHSGVAYPS